MSSAGVAISPIPNEAMLPPDYVPPPGESILVYVAVSGSMIPMRVLESDSIESVKLRIQSYKGFVVKNQRLVCGGRELARSNSLVREYGVTDGNVLHLVLRLSDLQVISVKTSCGKEYTFHVEKNRDVGYVKRQLARKKRGLVAIEDEEVICNGERVEDQRLINDICKENDAVIHLFVQKSAKIRAKPVDKHFELSIIASRTKVKREDELKRDDISVPNNPLEKDLVLEPIIVNPKIELSSTLKDLLDLTSQGLEKGNYPVRTSEGTGGAYFMPADTGNSYVSIFKPVDEEPMAVNNPRDLPLSVDGEGLKKGTRVGQGALREVAAYLIDHPKNGRRSFVDEEKGFSGVPLTTMVKCLHKGFNHPDGVKSKIGSLQKFMSNMGSCEDMGYSGFPIDEVHKISVLDIRMANADRHGGNILVSKGEDGRIVLIPIDHGYCLPDNFEDCTFEWLYWPQAKQPFNDETIKYIESLDAEEDIAILKFYGWDLPLTYARMLRISTMLLKKGVKKGLTSFAIGSIMCRERLNKESVIEDIVQEALNVVLPDSSEDTFMESVALVMDRHLNNMVI